MFHPQTIEIQPSKAECFSLKTLKFQPHDVIIYDVNADFGILFGMWNILVMSYPCAKFHNDMTINNRNNCIHCDRSTPPPPPQKKKQILNMSKIVLSN